MCAAAALTRNPQPDRLTLSSSGTNFLSRTPMKLCGQISVELNVGDYIEAADHQKRLEDILRLVAFTGKLGDYGIKSPLASEGVGVALGAEYRREHLDSIADFLSTNGLVSGNG